MEGIIAKVCNAYGFDLDTNELILSCKTLIDSSLSITVEELLLRAGQNNGVIGTVYHSGDVSYTLTDQQWNLNYLAMKNGGAITATSDLIKLETITTNVANQITITGTPVAFNETSGTIGWYKLSTENDEAYTKITFSGQTANVSNLPSGAVICVKYPIKVVSARELKIDSNFAPKTIRLILETPILKSSASSSGLQGASEVGKITFDNPQFQFNPAHEASMASGSGATTALSGRALINYGGGCDNDSGYFCIIKEEEYNASEFDNVSNLVIPNSDIDLATNGTHQIEVYKMYSNGTSPSPVYDTSLLTFTSKTEGVATVSNSGLITAVGAGQSTIEINVTDDTSLSASCAVTVTAS